MCEYSNKLAKLKEEYNIGQAIFEKLFKKSDFELKEILLDILNNESNDILKNSCSITRTIINEKPTEIIINFYDEYIINWHGISYRSEHGIAENKVIFNKYFKI